MVTKPVLSICIPTYNRAELLDYVLNGIFSQCNEDILQKIEVVISDNDSNDET
jgi:abequosyltransferase